MPSQCHARFLPGSASPWRVRQIVEQFACSDATFGTSQLCPGSVQVAGCGPWLAAAGLGRPGRHDP
eukprot:14261154-Alexandrium_andersonii.AAC.1